MKTLVLGNGGREHALLTALSRDPQVSALHAAPGNAGMADLATLHAVEATDPAAIPPLEVTGPAKLAPPDDTGRTIVNVTTTFGVFGVQMVWTADGWAVDRLYFPDAQRG